MKITLTPKENKLIEKLRKQELRWPRTRWLVLVIGTLCTFNFFGYAYFVHMLVRESGRPIDSDTLLAFALVWTKCCMYFVLATLVFATAWKNWHGDMNRLLLLKLLEAQQNERDSDRIG